MPRLAAEVDVELQHGAYFQHFDDGMLATDFSTFIVSPAVVPRLASIL
jgi:hypothetical protein